eukprot:56042_1
MNTFTVLLVIVLVGASGSGSLVNASAKHSFEEYEKELLVSGKIRADECAMGIQIPYEIRDLVDEFLPAPEYAIRIKSFLFDRWYYDVMAKDGLEYFMQDQCVVGVTNRDKSKKYDLTSVEFTEFATGQPINSDQALGNIWIDFHLNTHGDGGVFRQVLADASDGIHEYEFEIDCKQLYRHFIRTMFESHSTDKDFIQLLGPWKAVQAKLGGLVRNHLYPYKLTFTGS